MSDFKDFFYRELEASKEALRIQEEQELRDNLAREVAARNDAVLNLARLAEAERRDAPVNMYKTQAAQFLSDGLAQSVEEIRGRRIKPNLRLLPGKQELQPYKLLPFLSRSVYVSIPVNGWILADGSHEWVSGGNEMDSNNGGGHGSGFENTFRLLSETAEIVEVRHSYGRPIRPPYDILRVPAHTAKFMSPEALISRGKINLEQPVTEIPIIKQIFGQIAEFIVKNSPIS